MYWSSILFRETSKSGQKSKSLKPGLPWNSPPKPHSQERTICLCPQLADRETPRSPSTRMDSLPKAHVASFIETSLEAQPLAEHSQQSPTKLVSVGDWRAAFVWSHGRALRGSEASEKSPAPHLPGIGLHFCGNPETL